MYILLSTPLGFGNLQSSEQKRTSAHWEMNDEGFYDHDALESLPEKDLLVIVQHLDHAGLYRLKPHDGRLPIIARQRLRAGSQLYNYMYNLTTLFA